MKKTSYFLIIGILGFCSCTKVYQPTVTTTDYNYLVLEGTINTGPDSTLLKLSRSVRLTEGTATRPELKAIMTIEDEHNNSLTLTERPNGRYYAASLNLNQNLKYRLRIKTSNGKTYLSDYVPVKISPPIDSLGFTIKSDGVDIYCNSHDPSASTRYYRWDYQETWLFSPPFIANFISDGKQLRVRTGNEFVYRCWQSANSTAIALGTSTKLSQDIIYQGRVATISSTSDKISFRYSMLVKQYALTKEAYQFWQDLKTNTENLGSIFDAQPSALKGNIHNIADANEPVLGFVSIGSIQTSRIFVDKTELPADWVSPKLPTGCAVDKGYFKNPATGSDDVANTLIPLPPVYLALRPFFNEHPPYEQLGWDRTPTKCADCTLNGGSNIQPAFWK